LIALVGKLAPNAAELTSDPVDLVLYLFEPLRKRAQASLEPLDIARRGQVESAHGRVLSLERLLAGSKGSGNRVLEHLTVEQRLSEFPDRLLAAGAQAVLVVVLGVHRRFPGLIDISLTGASGWPEILPHCRHEEDLD
jgi:hypothetical protein